MLIRTGYNGVGMQTDAKFFDDPAGMGIKHRNTTLANSAGGMVNDGMAIRYPRGFVGNGVGWVGTAPVCYVRFAIE